MSAAPTAGATYLPGAEAAYARGYFQAPPGEKGVAICPSGCLMLAAKRVLRLVKQQARTSVFSLCVHRR
jgi:hypothetical protein